MYRFHRPARRRMALEIGDGLDFCMVSVTGLERSEMDSLRPWIAGTAIHKKHIGDLQLFSVLALCDVEGAEREVRLVNRYRIDSKASNILADQDTNGWLWSTNGKNVIAWMPLPVPFKE